jgi:hypothetical protein
VERGSCEAEFSQDEVVKVARRYLATLHPTMQLVIKMRYLGGLSYGEIAQRLKTETGYRFHSAAAVVVVHDHAIELLRARLIHLKERSGE